MLRLIFELFKHHNPRLRAIPHFPSKDSEPLRGRRRGRVCPSGTCESVKNTTHQVVSTFGRHKADVQQERHNFGFKQISQSDDRTTTLKPSRRVGIRDASPAPPSGHTNQHSLSRQTEGFLEALRSAPISRLRGGGGSTRGLHLTVVCPDTLTEASAHTAEFGDTAYTSSSHTRSCQYRNIRSYSHRHTRHSRFSSRLQKTVWGIQPKQKPKQSSTTPLDFAASLHFTSVSSSSAQFSSVDLLAVILPDKLS